jgi:GNAT superfamily N-acetyltransferase
MTVEFLALSPTIIKSRIGDLLSVAADVPGEYWALDNFLLDMPRKWDLSFAAYDGADLLGYAILSEKPPFWLHHFMLRKDRRNIGLGTSMMRRVLELCPGPIGLKTAAENDQAIRFYKRFGFATGETENRPTGRYVTMLRP